jgi:hypothetical protein
MFQIGTTELGRGRRELVSPVFSRSHLVPSKRDQIRRLNGVTSEAPLKLFDLVGAIRWPTRLLHFVCLKMSGDLVSAHSGHLDIH